MINIYFDSAVLIFVYMALSFLVATFRKDNSLVDIGWGGGFVAIVWMLGMSRPPIDWLLTAMVSIWGFRLAAYIYIRHQGEDWRYRAWREAWGKRVVLIAFFRVFMLQGAVMWVVALPLMAVYRQAADRGQWFNNDYSFSQLLIFGIGGILWLIGFLWESIADYQLFRFKRHASNRGKIMTQGLWAYSRHPNYFGEIVLWWGVFIYSIPYGQWWISVISPIIMTWLLVRVSGVKMLERKYKNNIDYQDYKKRVPALFPRFW